MSPAVSAAATFGLAGGAFAGAIIATVLGWFAWRRRPRPGATSFAGLSVLTALWVALYGGIILSTDVTTILYLFDAILIVQSALPLVWLVFAYDFAGRADDLPRRRIAVLSVPLAATTLVYVLRPELLLEGTFTVVPADGLWLPTREPNALGVVSMLYAYGLVLAGFGVLIRLLASTAATHRRQIVLVVLATFLPTVSSVAYQVGLTPVAGLDMTPYAVATQAIFLFYALFGVRLFDVTPVARAEVLDTLDAAVVVLDDDRVVDANPSARAFAAVEAPPGHPFVETFPEIASAVAAGQETVAVAVEGDRRSYAIRESPFSGRGQHGRVLVLTDVTDRLDRERALETLSIAASDLMEAGSREEICERTVQAATDFLSLPLCTVRLAEGDELVPVASTSRAVELYDTVGRTVPSFAVGESVVGTAYAQQAPIGFEDVRQAPMLSDPDTPYRSIMVFPLGDHGTLTVGSPEQVAVDEETRYFAGILAANVTYALDGTAREADLELQNERLDEFASVVSHDLRNPLAVAEGFLDFAREEHGEDESFDRIEDSLTRIGVIAGDLLTMARTGSPDDQVPVVLSSVVERAWENVVTHDAELVVGVDDLEVSAIPNRLQQALENLFRNAIEHGLDADAIPAVPGSGPSAASRDAAASGDATASGDAAAATDGGAGDTAVGDGAATAVVGSGFTVTVGRLDDGGFYVADNGPGIPADLRDRVFDRGVSGRDGTGLGLAIVQSVANEHGWHVEVTESASGGAQFDFRV